MVCKEVSEGDCELQLTDVLTGFCLVGSRELSALLPHVCYEPIWKRPATFQHGCFPDEHPHYADEASSSRSHTDTGLLLRSNAEHSLCDCKCEI